MIDIFSFKRRFSGNLDAECLHSCIMKTAVAIGIWRAEIALIFIARTMHTDIEFFRRYDTRDKYPLCEGKGAALPAIVVSI